MDERSILASFNDISIDEEEIKRYEETKIDDSKLREIESRINNVIIKSNFSSGIDTVVKEFDIDESAQHIFLGTAYGAVGSVVGASLVAGGATAGTMAYWGDMGRNIAAILTNKRLFIVYGNAIWKFLKIKNFKLDEIKHIKAVKKKEVTVVSLKPVNTIKSRNNIYDDTIRINVYNDKYLEVLDYIQKNNTKIKVSIEGEKRINKVIKRCLWGFFIGFAVFLIIGCIINWIINPVIK